jgi:hypothetical protein
MLDAPLAPRRFLILVSVKSYRPQGQSAAERMAKTEKSNGLTGNRTHDLWACSHLVPQPTILPRAPVNIPLKEDIGQFVMVFLADS